MDDTFSFYFKTFIFCYFWFQIFWFLPLKVIAVRIFFQSSPSSYLIVNQRLFHNFDFFVFFINIFVGLYSFIARLGVNMMASLLWLSRLDKNMMPRGYEFNDPGYRTYVGFLLLDYHHCNPTTIAFSNLLIQMSEKRKRQHQRFIDEVSVFNKENNVWYITRILSCLVAVLYNAAN